MPSQHERMEFRAYVRGLTDSQVYHVYVKEQAAMREEYEQIAHEEMIRRGIEHWEDV